MKILLLAFFFSALAGGDSRVEPGEVIVIQSTADTTEVVTLWGIDTVYLGEQLIIDPSSILTPNSPVAPLEIIGRAGNETQTVVLTVIPPNMPVSHPKQLFPTDSRIFDTPKPHIGQDSILYYQDYFRSFVWGDCTLVNVDTVYDFSGNSFFSNPRVSKKIQIANDGFLDYVYLSVPDTANGKLAWVTYGHGDSYNINGLPLAIDAFLDSGYHVLSKHMVVRGENTGPVSSHNGFQGHIGKYENNLRYFFEPYFVATSWALDNYALSDSVVFTGISGGGWLAMYYPLLDDRVSSSFSVAGWMLDEEMDYYFRNSGDYEQGYDRNNNGDGNYESAPLGVFHAQLHRANLPVIASYNRRLVIYRNTIDPCCFSGWGFIGYLPGIRSYINTLNSGQFDFFVYSEIAHTYTTEVVNHILSNVK